MSDKNASASSALLQRVFWRLHFWAGILTAPIMLIAAITGILYIFTPQIEAWKHADLDLVKHPAPALALEQQIAAAKGEVSHLNLRTIVPAYQEGETSFFIFGEKKSANKKEEVKPMVQHDEHAGHIMPATNPEPQATQSDASKKMGGESHSNASSLLVYVDPTTAQVQGQLAEKDRFKEWSRKLHSTLLQGDGWRWIIELGACWLLVLMLSGIYLWWPRGKAGWKEAFTYPRSNGKSLSRLNWRYLHSVTSIVLALLTIVIILTGITWSKYAGDNFKTMQSSLGQQAPRPPKDLQSNVLLDQAPLSAQAILEIAKAQAPAIRIQMTPPKGKNGVWRIENYDRSQPEKRFVLMLDAYNGANLFQSGWNNFPALARATAVGIPFHRGEFGWWNQALLLLVGISVIFSIISGYAMWLKRRKTGQISAPKMEVRHVTAIPWWLYLLSAALAYALPVFGISLLIFIGLEALSLLLQRLNIYSTQ